MIDTNMFELLLRYWVDVCSDIDRYQNHYITYSLLCMPTLLGWRYALLNVCHFTVSSRRACCIELCPPVEPRVYRSFHQQKRYLMRKAMVGKRIATTTASRPNIASLDHDDMLTVPVWQVPLIELSWATCISMLQGSCQDLVSILTFLLRMTW
jgi:hypothetical protein